MKRVLDIMTNYEIAQEINNRIGDVPVTDSLYEAALTIYQQLGGEVSEFDDVYSILQSIKEIARPGGDPITKVSVLPKSGEEYETKFLRTPDDKIYTTGKVTMPAIYTNRLPDAQQIDKAYLWEDAEYQYHYVGAYTVMFSDSEVSGYGWLDYYGEHEWYFYLTEDDAEHIQANSVCYGSFTYEDGDTIDLVNKTVTTQGPKSGNKSTLGDISELPVPATYNAPEASQIGNATLDIVEGEIEFVYDGSIDTIIVDGEEFTGYKWLSEDNPGGYLLTDKQASSIYYYTDYDNRITYSDAKCYLFDGSDIREATIMFLSIPQLNASDAEQVGKASITDEENGFVYKYEGDTLYTLTDDYQHTYYGYKWVCNDDEQGTIFVFTNEKASDIYSGNAIIYLAGAVDAWEYIGNNTYHETEGVSINYATLVDFDYSHSTVKYQRLDKTQSTLYGWQQVTVNGLILDEPVKKRYLLRGADLPSMRNEYGLTLREAWVNFNDETYTFNGKTYYKWIKYDDVYEEWKDGRKNAPSIPDSYMRDGNEIWMLTTTLTPKLPFTLKSPECAYVITTNGETAEGENYIVVDRECPKMAIEYTNGIISYFD